MPEIPCKIARFANVVTWATAGAIIGATIAADPSWWRVLVALAGWAVMASLSSALEVAVRQGQDQAGDSVAARPDDKGARPGELVPCDLCRQRTAQVGDRLCQTCRRVVDGGLPEDVEAIRGRAGQVIGWRARIDTGRVDLEVVLTVALAAAVVALVATIGAVLVTP